MTSVAPPRPAPIDGKTHTFGSRAARHALLLLAVLLATVLPEDGRAAEAAAAEGWCQLARVTGYVRTEFSPRTYDGSSIYSDEPIAAASWNIPLGWHVRVADVGTFRVADRGMLGSSGWVDIAVWSRAEAYALTSVREICVYPVE